MVTRVVIYGVGPIGHLIARVALDRGFDVVGAIDIDPQKVGKDLGDVLGLGKSLGIKVENDADKVLKDSDPDVVLHSTGSYFDKVYSQIMRAIRVGTDVVSTCETLSWPWYRYPDLAELIDNYARDHGATVLGAGVNPGFVFDALPAVLSVALTKLNKITVIRSLDASKRRYSFQRKIGLGMTPSQFTEALSRGEITAHVGFPESVLLLASIIGLRLDRVEEGQEALIAERNYETQYFKVGPGQVKGVVGHGSGFIGGREVIRVELRACVGCEDFEEVRLEGEPSITWRSTGTPGDPATAAVIVNLIPRVLSARPGLITLKDLINYSYAEYNAI
ncbi:NAD(P)H-dependent amine dehydrogenase family protein [Vulcanisaeta souniana]|uniref:Dihydrodipicolinate reductase n=1 Tax=Vulcanisaeta souniana JCM 11219 TaxID=1293586 RepID=A0A830E5D0_9CREN|nr:dihydrodipicolinate reductase [Vulcanisaeta souniana]BDR92961.1 dihydrodipicolinate reductase [Vulcanisaeta souniana JCM 11219]GGI83886.1 dihydrodipicolinate reductase [Vulcanisaeta souniana JCM 11219]